MVAPGQDLVSALDKLLDDRGLLPCLFALAHAIRGENDKRPPPACLTGPEVQRCYVREYLANQLVGLATFWRVHLLESDWR